MGTIVRQGKRFGPNDSPDPLRHLSLGVLYGGPSAERSVSLESGEAVARALTAAGHTVHRVVLDGTFNTAIARSLEIDVAFLALHGEFGEDGRIQLILEEAGIPYTGSGVDASAAAFDKILAKAHLEKNGILTPAWMALDREDLALGLTPTDLELNPPLAIKPAACGSSLGVTIVRDPSQIESALVRAFEFGASVLLERFIPGRELTVAIVGDEPLPVCELEFGGEFFDFRAKYQEETRILCPAPLTREETAKVQAAALATHRALGCRDLSRVDLILDGQGLPWVLELNTLPGLTSHSLLPRAAAAAGIGFLDLCEDLLRRALRHSVQKA